MTVVRGPLVAIMFSIGLLCVATAPALADGPARPVSVACDVFEIWASHGKGTSDPKVPKQLAQRLANTLKQTDFKLQSHNKVTLATKKPRVLKFARGSATITLVETVNKAQARLTVDFTAANKLKSTATQLVSAGDWVVSSVNQANSAKADAHVLAVGSCK